MRNLARAAMLVLLCATNPGQARSEESAGPQYNVQGNRVDARTFVGWRVYHETCVTCHGADAVTTGAAPGLLDAIGNYTATQFAMKVRSRYLVAIPGDSQGSETGSAVRESFLAELQRHESAEAAPVEMPSWDSHPLVHDRIIAIYSYLKARADGALGPGKPEVLK